MQGRKGRKEKSAALRRRRRGDEGLRSPSQTGRMRCPSQSSPCRPCNQYSRSKAHAPITEDGVHPGRPEFKAIFCVKNNRSSESRDKIQKANGAALSIGISKPPAPRQSGCMDPDHLEEAPDRDPAQYHVSFPKPIDVLPSWKVMDHLFAPHFSLALEQTRVSCVEFYDEYWKTRETPEAISLCWLSIIFSVLSCACRVNPNAARKVLLKRLAVKYETAAADCITLNHSTLDQCTELSETARKTLVRTLLDRVNHNHRCSGHS